MFRIVIALLTGVLLSASNGWGRAKNCITAIEQNGSLPPLPELYTCIHRLNGDPYDATTVNSCLTSLMASGYFEDGRIRVSPQKSSLVVTFILKSRSLTITGVDFEVESPRKEELLDWIERGKDCVKEGEVYETKRDDRTTEVIEMFFWSIGKQVGVTRQVDLDYHRGTAHLSYHVSVGPNMIPVRGLPPYEPACQHSISSYNLTDLDDYVPINLVEEMTRTHAFGCFDPEVVRDDEKALQDSSLFAECRYDLEGSEGARQISLHLRGKPLVVKDVRMSGYGSFSDQFLGATTGLKLVPGDVYRRSIAYETLAYLQEKYAQSNEVVKVFEHDQMARDGKLEVVFEIFGYKNDTVVVNGKLFHVMPPVIRGGS